MAKPTQVERLAGELFDALNAKRPITTKAQADHELMKFAMGSPASRTGRLAYLSRV